MWALPAFQPPLLRLVARRPEPGHQTGVACARRTVFRVARLGYLYVGRGVAACEACVVPYLGRYHGTRPDDLRCEVCGEEQAADAVFTQLMVPNGGVIVIADACVSCTEWLAGAFGVET